MDNPYVELTTEFNHRRLRAVLSSGQAVVLHRLAIMSKDGDWILREDEEALTHVLSVLGRRGARYRFGAPLDVRWLAGGWSAHLEHRRDNLRLRTDFVTRPPRISAAELKGIWDKVREDGVPVVGLEPLVQIKKTNREKDYAIIGDLVRRVRDPRFQLLHSRSARDLMRLGRENKVLLQTLVKERPVLKHLGLEGQKGNDDERDAIESSLDAERRTLMRVNEKRLALYLEASREWTGLWPQLTAEVAGLPLLDAHRMIVERAESVLPFEPRPGHAL
jgi:hypothetical protein